MDRQTAIDKIKKCLRLAKSSEPAEAAAALRQAKKLMAEFGFNDEAAFEAGEADAKSGAKVRPTDWEVNLAAVVADAFACRRIFVESIRDGKWRFVGANSAEQIAAYSFAVLLRQCRAARADHIAKRLKRCTPANRIRRADEFCRGWVQAASRLIASQQPTTEQEQAITAYYATHYPSLTKLEPTKREVRRQSGDGVLGYIAGHAAQLNAGVGGTEAPLAIGG